MTQRWRGRGPRASGVLSTAGYGLRTAESGWHIAAAVNGVQVGRLFMIYSSDGKKPSDERVGLTTCRRLTNKAYKKARQVYLVALGASYVSSYFSFGCSWEQIWVLGSSTVSFDVHGDDESCVLVETKVFARTPPCKPAFASGGVWFVNGATYPPLPAAGSGARIFAVL